MAIMGRHGSEIPSFIASSMWKIVASPYFLASLLPREHSNNIIGFLADVTVH